MTKNYNRTIVMIIVMMVMLMVVVMVVTMMITMIIIVTYIIQVYSLLFVNVIKTTMKAQHIIFGFVCLSV